MSKTISDLQCNKIGFLSRLEKSISVSANCSLSSVIASSPSGASG